MKIENLSDNPGKATTYRKLLLWLEDWAKHNEDGELDMPIVVHVTTEEDCYTGGLYLVEVNTGCTDTNALILHADSEEGVEGEEDETEWTIGKTASDVPSRNAVL